VSEEASAAALQPGSMLETVASRLNEMLVAAGIEPLDSATGARFAAYCELLLRWNARTNLTAIRDQEGILSRHFVESIACARALPPGIGTLLDFGSGAGFPGIPVALCRAGIAVTLAESQGKKAAFLREAVRVLGLSAKVHSARAETLTETFDCVTLRAVDRMGDAVRAALGLVRIGGRLALMTTEEESPRLKASCGDGVLWEAPIALPGGDHRILMLGVRR
jgi:16S rRNA (guanine527-N7)-methyltransferase